MLKVARTIADLAGSEAIETPHLAEAIQYRRRGRDQRGVEARRAIEAGRRASLE